jgi:hypothetical protein
MPERLNSGRSTIMTTILPRVPGVPTGLACDDACFPGHAAMPCSAYFAPGTILAGRKPNVAGIADPPRLAGKAAEFVLKARSVVEF